MHLDTAGLKRFGAALWLMCMLAAWTPARAMDGAAPPAAAAKDVAARTLDFDIPAQPLHAALKQYAATSGWPILFHSAMVGGRTSTALRGTFAPEFALRRLLDGTGLVAEKVRSAPADVYVLREAVPNETAHAAAPSAPDGSHVDFGYGGWVQARVWDALCANPRTAPGAYRWLLRFRVDPAGRVHRVRMISSSGNAHRDAAVLQTVQAVHVGLPPPPEMAQPLTLLLLPSEQTGGRACDGAGVGAGARSPAPAAADADAVTAPGVQR